MLLVSGVDRCLREFEMKPVHESMPFEYAVEIGTSTATVTAADTTQRFCAVVSDSLRSRQHCHAILMTSGMATKPGKMRKSAAYVMKKPDSAGRCFFMQHMPITIAAIQSMRRKAPPVHQ